jgi:hypothetical protein
MWDKRIMRLLAIVYLVEGAVALLAPERMSRRTAAHLKEAVVAVKPSFTRIPKTTQLI